jgi:mannose-6-phosphate isomerase-like protein (cupin superfamily)
MTAYITPSDSEREALWYLGGQRIIAALCEQDARSLRLTEWATPAKTMIFALRRQPEEEGYYVFAGEADVAHEGKVTSIGAGTFLFVPGHVPYRMEVSPSGPLCYLKWVAPAGFAHGVTQLGSRDQAWLLAPPYAPDRAKILHLAGLLRSISS